MPLFKNYKAIISNVLMLLLFSANVKAQVKGGGTGTSYSCTGCTTIITSPASTNFSVNVGQIVCIAPNVTYTGNITLNGGTICNQGTLTRVVFKSGVFNNLGTFVTAAGLSIAASNDLLINCYNRSTFAVKGGLNLRSIYTGDSIIITLHENSLFTTNTSFTSRNTILKIYNGSQNEYPQSYFNVGTDFSIGDSTDFRLDNWNDFNIGRNINFTATGNKRINNYYSYSLSSSRFIPSYMNLFNVNGSFNISGTGNTTDKVIIDNYNPTFNITKNLTSSIANAKVKIINESFINSSPLTTNFYVGQSVTLNNLTDTILNNGLFKANLISISRGTFINQGDFYSNSDLKVINGGKFFNNFIINTVRSGEVISPVDANAATSRNLIVNTQGLFSNKLGGIVTIARNLIVNTQGLFSNKSFAKISNNTSLNSGTVTNDSIIYAGALTLQNLSQALNTGTLSGGNILLSNSIFTTTKKVIADSSIKALTNSTLTNSGILTANGNIQITTSTFSNSSTVSAGKDILIQSNATATNNGSVTATRNVKITSASLTNNNYVLANNNLDVANSVAIYNNNGYTEVSDSLHNIGTVNLSQLSGFFTKNYFNLGASGIINADFSLSDTISLAWLVISDYSRNTGYVNGTMLLHDQTLIGSTNNNGYGFDEITNSNRISNNILFANNLLHKNK